MLPVTVRSTRFLHEWKRKRKEEGKKRKKKCEKSKNQQKPTKKRHGKKGGMQSHKKYGTFRYWNVCNKSKNCVPTPYQKQRTKTTRRLAWCYKQRAVYDFFYLNEEKGKTGKGGNNWRLAKNFHGGGRGRRIGRQSGLRHAF